MKILMDATIFLCENTDGVPSLQPDFTAASTWELGSTLENL